LETKLEIASAFENPEIADKTKRPRVSFAGAGKAVCSRAKLSNRLGEIAKENLFDKIHSDPRWLPFLRKIGRDPDHLAKIEFKMPPLPLRRF
jgi:hypothetical protein